MLNSLTHHAYGIAGKQEEILPGLFEALKKTGFNIRGNPDFRSEIYDIFGIDEARGLKKAAYRRGVTGGLPATPGRPAQAGKKVFVISAHGITKEAQNALLKIAEEPPEDTQFFLVVPSLEILLPTLRSRLHILSDVPAGKTADSSPAAAAFLGDPVPKRLKTIQGMLKAAEEESGKQPLVDFLDGLERSVSAGDRARNAAALSEILEVKKYSRDRAPSFKLLLEHLALVLPRS